MGSRGIFSWRGFDWVLLGSVFLLFSIGLAAVYSVDLSRGSELFYFKKQLIAAVIGFCALGVASRIQVSLFRSYAKPLYVFSLALLSAVLLFGTNIRGTKGWFTLGTFSFQPVEVAKVGIIFILGYVVYYFGRRFERRLFFFGTMFLTLVVMGLVMLQPDLGSSVIIGTVWFGIMWLVGARRRYLVGLVALAAVFSIFAWFFFLQDYQKNRILDFIHPERNALTSGYNSTQALIAVGAGKWFGRGLGFGSQSQLRFLPEAQTDFIFSVIAEELGFAGTLVLIILYGVMLWRLLVIINGSHDDFAATVVSGIAILFFAQGVVNIGANIGLLPITGVTLPLVSYGGSSLMVNLFLVGVAEAMVEKKY